MLAVISISPLWYISRSAGFVGMALLAIIGILGIITAANLQFGRGARFVAPEVHRSLSLLAVVVLIIHVGAAVLDKYSHIGFKDIFIPFLSQYRPIWVGVGAVAIDLGLAVLITSLLRVKMGYRSWKAIHWIAYPIFVLSLIHALGTGSDTVMSYGKLFYLVIGGVFVLAVIARLLSARQMVAGRKIALIGLSFVVSLVILVWTFVGPLASNWATRAKGGLAQAVLTSTKVPVKSTTTTTTEPRLRSLVIGSGYTSGWSGKVDESPANSQGEIAIRLIGTLSQDPSFKLSIVLIGFPQDGGVSMASSLVEIASDSGTILYKGTVTSLSGTTIVSSISSATGASVTINSSLTLSNSSSSFSGTVKAS